MAEIKNSFLRSKMNKDLDDRLIPNGEYRDAFNISVGKSEDDDIGALETIKGNVLKTDFGLTNVNIETIGYYSDEPNNRFIVFLTDYNDTNDNPTLPSSTNNCYIYEFTPANNTPTLLVSGIFLNFSKSNPITGVDLIEDLLFFTDNRNQPRKINITKALSSSTYYTQESDISVATYNPYEGISLINKTSKAITVASTGNTLTVADNSGVIVGMSAIVYTINSGLEVKDFARVISLGGSTTIVLSKTATIAQNIIVYFYSATMTGQDITLNFNGGLAWPGDPQFLEDKFVRFSYRFKFDDGEYSIMAPFTQIGFIPKQKGYFLEDQENSAFRSTILEFMENGVQNIELKIPLPDVQNNIGVESSSTYKILAIDILYKESDGVSVKVLDTIESIGTSTTSNEYIYKYQSRKPFKTLPSEQTVRVYDKVPVKALGQAVSGNRVIYGNFLDKYTAPRLLNYRVSVSSKNTTSDEYTNWSEYPNHSLKQNRTYQVGFILSDKYGRQSDVILSLVDLNTETDAGIVYGGSTIYAPYHANNLNPTVKDWFGDALRLILNTGISSGVNGNPSTTGDTNGQPGLYANPIADGFNIAGTATSFPAVNKYRFVLNGSVTTGLPINGSALRGQYIDYVYVTNVAPPAGGAAYYEITCDGPINQEIYSLSSPVASPDNKFAYNINPEGWYSYKIVVKQQQQDYYNVYLPGILAGYPGQPLPTTTQENLVSSSSFYLNLGGGATKSNDLIQVGMVVTSDDPTEVIGNPTIITKKNANEFTFSITQSISVDELIFYRVPGELSLFPADEIGKTANIVLINDNINKVPRDLAEVGPDQKQFRSSVQLFGRVSNSGFNFNEQYFPGILSDTVVSISTASDSNIKSSTVLDQNYQSLYQFDTNPLIARLEVQTQKTTFGVAANNPAAGAAVNLTIATAPTIPVEVNMIITNNGVDTSGAVIGTVYGVVTAIISTTSFTCRLAIGPNGTPALKFTLTIGSPNGRSRLEDFTLMEPTLAIYETEPVESLLDIFWETNTVGLIGDINEEVATSFNGPTGWGAYTWTQPESLAIGANVVTGLFPVNSSTINLTSTVIVGTPVITDANGNAADFTIELDPAATGAQAGSYRIKLNSFYTFLNAVNPRTFTVEAIIKDNVSGITSNSITVIGALSNVLPSFTTTTKTVSQSFQGTVDTLIGLNGGADTSGSPPSNKAELRWSIDNTLGGNNAGYFSINETTGIITKSNASAVAGTYNIVIKLEDAWDGSTVKGGFLNVTQVIIINSTTVGTPFNASDPGVFSQTCRILPGPPQSFPLNSTCGVGNGGASYYNRTQGTSTIAIGDVIATGPNANSAFAAAGTYSYRCNDVGQNNRYYFKIQNSNDGIVTDSGVC